MARRSGWSSEQSPRARRLCRRAEFRAQRALLAAAGSSASDTVIRITRSSTAAIRIDVGAAIQRLAASRRTAAPVSGLPLCLDRRMPRAA